MDQAETDLDYKYYYIKDPFLKSSNISFERRSKWLLM